MIFTFISLALYVNLLMYWNNKFRKFRFVYQMYNKFRFVFHVPKPICNMHVFVIYSFLCMFGTILKLRMHVLENTLSPSLLHVSMIVCCLGCLYAKLHSYTIIKHVYLVRSYEFRNLHKGLMHEKGRLIR